MQNAELKMNQEKGKKMTEILLSVLTACY